MDASNASPTSRRSREAFEVQAGLEETDFAPGDDLRPQSMQPVVYTNERWRAPDRDDALGVQTPRPSSLQCAFRRHRAARSSGRMRFSPAALSHPAMPSSSGRRCRQGQKKPKYEITIPGQEPFGMAAVWKLWKNPKTDQWERTFAILTGDPNELIASIHDRMTTFLEPRDYEEYLAPSERPPVHLLRILPAEKMHVQLVENSPITNAQATLFDPQ